MKLLKYSQELERYEWTVAGQNARMLLAKFLALEHALSYTGQRGTSSTQCHALRQQLLQEGPMQAACTSFLSACWSELEGRVWQHVAQLGAVIAPVADLSLQAPQLLAACIEALTYGIAHCRHWIALSKAPSMLMEGLREDGVRRLAPGPLLQLRSAMRTLIEAWLEGMAQVSESLARTMVAAATSTPAAGGVPKQAGGNSGAAPASLTPAAQPLRGLWLRGLRLYYELYLQVQEWGNAHHMPWLGTSWRRSMHAAMAALSLISPLSSHGAQSQQKGGGGGAAAAAAIAQSMRATRESSAGLPLGSAQDRPSDRPSRISLQDEKAGIQRALAAAGQLAAAGVPSAKARQAASAAQGEQEAKQGVFAKGAAAVERRATVSITAAVGAATAMGHGLAQGEGVAQSAGATAAAPRTLLAYYMQAQAVMGRLHVGDTVDACAGQENADAVSLAAGNKMLTDLCHVQLMDLLNAFSCIAPTPPGPPTPRQPLPSGDAPRTVPANPSLVFRHHANDQQALVDALPPERLIRLAINPVTLALMAARLDHAPQPGSTPASQAPPLAAQQDAAPVGQPTRITSARPGAMKGSSTGPVLPPTPPLLRAAIQYGFTLFMHQMHSRMASGHYMSHTALFPPSRHARRQVDAAVVAANTVLSAGGPLPASTATGRTVLPAAPGATSLLQSQMPALVISELPVTSLLISLTSPPMLSRLMQHAGSEGGLLRALASSRAAAASAPAAAAVTAAGIGPVRRISRDGPGGSSWQTQGSSSSGEEELPNPVSIIVDTLCDVLTRHAALSTPKQNPITNAPRPGGPVEPGVLACAVWPLLANDASDRSATTMLSPMRDIFQVIHVGMALMQRSANACATMPHLYPGGASMRDVCVAHAQAHGLSAALRTLLQQAQVLAHSEWFDHAEPMSRASTLARALSRTFASSRSRFSSSSHSGAFFSGAAAAALSASDDEDDVAASQSLQAAYLRGVAGGAAGSGSAVDAPADGLPLVAASPAGYVLSRAGMSPKGVPPPSRWAKEGDRSQPLREESAPQQGVAGPLSAAPPAQDTNGPGGWSNRRVHPQPASLDPSITTSGTAGAAGPAGVVDAAGEEGEGQDPPQHSSVPRVLSRIGHAGLAGSGVMGWHLASADPSYPADFERAAPASPSYMSHSDSQLAGPLYIGIPGWRAPGPGSTGWLTEWAVVERRAGSGAPGGLGAGPCPSCGLVTSVPLSAAQLRVMEALHLHQLHMRAMLGLSSDLLAQEVRVVGRRLLGLPGPGAAGAAGKRLGLSGRQRLHSHDGGWPPKAHPTRASKGMADAVEQLLKPMLKALVPLPPGSHAYLATLATNSILTLYSEKVSGTPAAEARVGAAGPAAAHLAAQVALDCDLVRQELEQHAQDVRSGGGSGSGTGGLGAGAAAWAALGSVFCSLVSKVGALEAGWAARLGV